AAVPWAMRGEAAASMSMPKTKRGRAFSFIESRTPCIGNTRRRWLPYALGRYGLTLNGLQQKQNLALMRHEQVQAHEDEAGDRQQRHEHTDDQIAREHVRIQTDAEREDAREVAGNLDHDHQRGQPPHRAEELLDVSEAMLADSDRVI